ncbi:AraC family transcriptional regulator [Streptococcus parauberis]|uniref:AraC family transcriptional regulator n=1 Tax=Streptococcus parauberis TaxID=1348 RepID=UPI000345A841|nr:AraC family transcriptional regulator [Streptococcus parauberis]UWM86733.1 AraC family transcriptional regulator [Streptococcus parauberis]UWM88705.1 AraC family transcriptional regulator [Streptococcus parauberis]WEM59486.1 AraC family transcriptional regulator [Streptococcus parauberis]
MSDFLEEYTDSYNEMGNKSISDFILYNCGIEHCEPNYSYGPKRREYHFIHFVFEGQGKLEINQQKYTVQKNQFFIVPAGTVSTYTADKNNPWKYAWIGFLGIQAQRYLNQLRIGNEFVFDCKDAYMYKNKIGHILEQADNQLSSFLIINGLMYDIIGNLIAEIPTSEQVIQQESISKRAMHYMNLHYHDAIQISDVAKFVNLHPNYLANIFQDEVGISPKQYLTQLKLSKAKELLRDTDEPINIISSSVGFTDALTFSKFFKKITGQSPSTYRKESIT